MSWRRNEKAAYTLDFCIWINRELVTTELLSTQKHNL